MQGSSRWPHHDMDDRSRDRPFNNRYSRRPFVDRSRDVDVGYTNRGSSHSNSYSYEEHANSYPYLNTKRFPQHNRGPYDRPQHPRKFRRDHSYPDSNNTQQTDRFVDNYKVMTPLEAKTQRLIHAVKCQDGIKSQLVLLQSELDNPTVVLQNAVQSLKHCVLTIKQKENQIYELLINGEKLCEGTFQNKQTAKSVLCEAVMNDLRKHCFYIIKKRNYEEVSTEDINKANEKEMPTNTMEGSKAHMMMLKMGWKGKGLGSNEQGNEKTVAETLTQHVTKAGLGGKNVMNEIHGILEKFAASSKVTTLAFDSGFTKDERAHIHGIASKLNLKSKSEGKDDNRRITISKKIAKWDLVKELLLEGCENDSYKLIVPSEFESIWKNE